MPDRVPKKWISTREACRMTSFHRDSLARFAATDPDFPAPARFDNSLRYDAEALQAWMQGRVTLVATPKALRPQVDRLVKRLAKRGIDMTRQEAEEILRAR